MNEEDRKTFKITFKDQRRIINKEITLLDLVVEKQEEIERLNKQIEEYQKALDETTSKKIDLENIIKEVREYIDYYGITPEQNDDKTVRYILKGILEILDKGE